MKIALIIASELEWKKLQANLNKSLFNAEAKHELFPLITGVGMVATCYALTKFFAKNRVDIAINLGIAGSLNHQLELSEVFEVMQDQLIELGAESPSGFISFNELMPKEANKFPMQNGVLFANHSWETKLDKKEAITVNTVHGIASSITDLKKRTTAELESMEGAAFFYVCALEKVPSLAIRAVSNYVENRDASAWEIDKALLNLAIEFTRILDENE